MANFKTPVSVLEASARRSPSLPALKIPEPRIGSAPQTWKDVSFAQLLSNVETAARYWTSELTKKGCKPGSVVGLWLGGAAYKDILHIWGLQRAGYVPQLFSLKIDNSEILYNLLKIADATAIVCEAKYLPSIADCPLPAFSADVNVLTSDAEKLPLAPSPQPKADQVVMIFHTSGSSSGSPKLVPLTAQWLDFTIRKCGYIMPSKRDAQQTTVAVGLFCHVGNPMLFATFLDRAGCFICPTEIPYSSAELRQMVDKYGLTTLPMFGSYLSRFLREAQKDNSLLAILKGLDYVTYGGVAPDEAEEEWARQQGLNLVNIFGSTEVGFMMQSVTNAKNPAALAPLQGSAYEFVPVSDGSMAEGNLVELVIPPESFDCPHESLRNPATGKFHTGDLFLEVNPGEFLIKGRNDDWIKTEGSLRCDTKSIENNAMEMCGKDLIDVAVVVGAGRPSPVLIVESKMDISDQTEIERLRDEILKRTKPFHERRYVHERISDVRFIMVVPRGLLPRTATKGNVQRKIVEKQFKEALDGVYVG